MFYTFLMILLDEGQDVVLSFEELMEGGVDVGLYLQEKRHDCLEGMLVGLGFEHHTTLHF